MAQLAVNPLDLKFLIDNGITPPRQTNYCEQLIRYIRHGTEPATEAERIALVKKESARLLNRPVLCPNNKVGKVATITARPPILGRPESNGPRRKGFTDFPLIAIVQLNWGGVPYSTDTLTLTQADVVSISTRKPKRSK